MADDKQKKGERELEKIDLEVRQEKEKEQAEKFTKLHKMTPEETKEHLAEVEKEHQRQREELEKSE